MRDTDFNHSFHFDIASYQYLTAAGRVVADLPDSARDYRRLRELLHTMILVRTFDKRAIALQRTGQVGTYASCYGQEAIGAAIGDQLQADDVLLPSYRETPALLMRGTAMEDILSYWGGDERGMDWKHNREDFPVCVPIATHATHACGVAFAFKYRRQQRVALCTLGDGGTSKGDFYEAINLAGVWQLPLLVLVINNQWAISVPRAAQTGAETLAQKAIAAGVDCEIVDGNDLLAVRERLAQALVRVRAGKPCLIEARTYRLGDHTTADDASRYRTEEELSAHLAAEPILRLARYLETNGHWSDADQRQCQQDCDDRVEAAVDAYLAMEPPAPGAIFDHLYETLPAALTWQRQQAEDEGRGCG